MKTAKTSVAERHVIIVGGGFSGTLLAVNILRHAGPRVTLIERHNDMLARGIAYSAADSSHLLNVRAGGMSAFPDVPNHFVDWLQVNVPEAAAEGHGCFARRIDYGRYLEEQLRSAQWASDERLTILKGEVVSLASPPQTKPVVKLADGSCVTGDSLVIAVGNLPSHTPDGLDPDTLPNGVYAPDPWASDVAAGLTDDDQVLLLGTGLTAIDAALLLDGQNFGGKIIAASRRGLSPRRHDDHPRAAGLSERPRGSVSSLTRQVRTRTASVGWRVAIDEIRPVTQMMWGAATIDERSRFLRHARPFWDVHRHRLSPQVAEKIDAMLNTRRLEFKAAKLENTCAAGRKASVMLRYRGESITGKFEFARIVNCTGPQGDLVRTNELLLRDLLDKQIIRPDPLRIGLDVDSAGRVVGCGGVVSETIFSIGPMNRGAFWETVAVPDLRQHAWTLARFLSNAHWVEGEGL